MPINLYTVPDCAAPIVIDQESPITKNPLVQAILAATNGKELNTAITSGLLSGDVNNQENLSKNEELKVAQTLDAFLSKLKNIFVNSLEVDEAVIAISRFFLWFSTFPGCDQGHAGSDLGPQIGKAVVSRPIEFYKAVITVLRSTASAETKPSPVAVNMVTAIRNLFSTKTRERPFLGFGIGFSLATERLIDTLNNQGFDKSDEVFKAVYEELYNDGYSTILENRNKNISAMMTIMGDEVGVVDTLEQTVRDQKSVAATGEEEDRNEQWLFKMNPKIASDIYCESDPQLVGVYANVQLARDQETENVDKRTAEVFHFFTFCFTVGLGWDNDRLAFYRWFTLGNRPLATKLFVKYAYQVYGIILESAAKVSDHTILSDLIYNLVVVTDEDKKKAATADPSALTVIAEKKALLKLFATDDFLEAFVERHRGNGAGFTPALNAIKAQIRKNETEEVEEAEEDKAYKLIVQKKLEELKLALGVDNKEQ